MHEMQTIVTDVCSICQSVCLSRMHRMTPARLHCVGMCSVCRSNSVQPLTNYFGLLLLLCTASKWQVHTKAWCWWGVHTYNTISWTQRSIFTATTTIQAFSTALHRWFWKWVYYASAAECVHTVCDSICRLHFPSAVARLTRNFHWPITFDCSILSCSFLCSGCVVVIGDVQTMHIMPRCTTLFVRTAYA